MPTHPTQVLFTKGISLLAASSKEIRHRLLPSRGKRIYVFVVGCQRSGTTLMLDLFNSDWAAKVYKERSELSARGQEQLQPISEVRDILSENGYPLSLLKPLIDTQKLPEFLREVPNSKAIWMYRHYRAVAASNLKKFGRNNGINDIKPIALSEANNWRSEVVPGHVGTLIRKHYGLDMNPYDAACLFWLARNVLFFEQGHDQNPRVRLVRYETLVTSPIETMSGIYSFIGRPFPGRRMVSRVSSASLQSGAAIELTPEIEEHCERLWERMNAISFLNTDASPTS